MLAREPDPTKWLDAMPFTRAAFDEALRLYPPAPSINREPIEPETWKDLYIPKHAAVLVMPWVVHRHRKLWDRPDAFMPERFHPGNREKIDRFQYLPFGAGPRVCIGASFAMQEAIIALAIMLSRFRFDTTAETKPWPVQKLTTQPQGGLPMQVTPRLWRDTELVRRVCRVDLRQALRAVRLALELAGGAEAPEVARQDRRDRLRLDAEPGKRPVGLDGRRPTRCCARAAA